MSKRLILVVTCVISLLSVLLIVGSVLAQSPGSESSADSGPLRPIVPVATESAPAAGVPTRLDRCNSTQFGGRPDRAAGMPVVEREPGAANRSSALPTRPPTTAASVSLAPRCARARTTSPIPRTATAAAST